MFDASHPGVDLGRIDAAGRRTVYRLVGPMAGIARPSLRIRLGHPGDTLVIRHDPVRIDRRDSLVLDIRTPTGNPGKLAVAIRDGEGRWRDLDPPLALPGEDLPFRRPFDTVTEDSAPPARRIDAVRLTLAEGRIVRFHLVTIEIDPE